MSTVRKSTVDPDFAPTTFELDQAPDAGPSGRAPAFVRWLARLGLGPGRDGHDAQSGLLHRQAFLERGERLLAVPRWEARTALALFDFRDLLEVRGIYGERASAALLARIVAALGRLAGRHGLAGRTGPAQFAVLLPGLGRAEAVAAVHQVLGRPCRIEQDVDGEELVLVPDVVVEACDDRDLADQYARLVEALGRHRTHEERRHRYLRLERERHSRPAPLEDPLSLF
jgi:GGDEF domain-containing protein